MHDNRSHHLLAQVPLTVSPFVSLPTATTLPYTYKPMPSTLPPSMLSSSTTDAPPPSSSSEAPPNNPNAPPPDRPRFVVSASGHAAHPDDIIASCRALAAHVARLQADADAELAALEAAARARELAEKRRVAPGWLDSDARLLEPERQGGGAEGGVLGQHVEMGMGMGGGGGVRGQPEGIGLVSEMAAPDEGAELDRAFGVLALRPKGE